MRPVMVVIGGLVLLGHADSLVNEAAEWWPLTVAAAVALAVVLVFVTDSTRGAVQDWRARSNPQGKGRYE